MTPITAGSMAIRYGRLTTTFGASTRSWIAPLAGSPTDSINEARLPHLATPHEWNENSSAGKGQWSFSFGALVLVPATPDPYPTAGPVVPMARPPVAVLALGIAAALPIVVVAIL